MREGSKWLHLLLAGLLACSLALAGCSGDDGRDGQDGKDFQLPQGEYVGLANCAACHAGSGIGDAWAQSAHATTHGCGSCHDPLAEGLEADAFGVANTEVVGCETCHGPGSGHFGVAPIPVAAPGTDKCAECHSGDLPSWHVSRNPFSTDIAGNFGTSRHANQSARTGFCSACHSHEGGVKLLSMGRMTSVADLDDAYNAETVDAYMLPVGSDTIDGVMKKNCATCHDPHTTGLRGDGDQTALMLGLTDADSTTTEEATVVYSAEFNLCTACHMVDVDATVAGTGNNGRLLIDYTLSDAYTNANLVDAATGTFVEVELANAGRTVLNVPFYHDGASGNGRTMADTHFGGTIVQHLVTFPVVDSGEVDADGEPIMVLPAEGLNDTTITGYNVNAGAQNACTICHDPHTGGKMLAATSSTGLEGYPDVYENKAVGYAEGLGAFHTNYQTTASYRQNGCTPCHTGDKSYASFTMGRTAGQINDEWNVLGCRGCHDLAQPNAAPGSNNAEAFAQVREFGANHVFAFNSRDAAGDEVVSGGVVVDAAELGVNQICFECHKGRTPVVDETTLDEGETLVRTISYLHYAPSFATVFGVDSGMFPLYQDASQYAGRFAHFDFNDLQGTITMGCVDCHDVHDTDGNNAAANKLTNPEFSCVGCHTGNISAAGLEARVAAFSDALLDALFEQLGTYVSETGVVDATLTDTGLIATLEAMFEAATTNGDEAAAKALLAAHIEGRNGAMPTVAMAKAANVWKIFTYEDGAVDGNFGVHGHGGSWAHNSIFARQLMFDAMNIGLGLDAATIEAEYGLTRP